jgi:hypothetical protein
MPGFNVGDRVVSYQRGYPDEIRERPHYITTRRMVNEDGSLRVAAPEETPHQYTVRRLDDSMSHTAMYQGQLVEVDYVLSDEPGDTSAEYLEAYTPPPPPEE